jgi:superoxide reductase
MKEHVPNTVEASVEKHLPVIEAVGDKMAVSVGSAPHPMTEEHYIAFVYAETKNGGQRKGLRPGGEPAAVFAFVEDSPVAVYAYCNLHGLWKTEV